MQIVPQHEWGKKSCIHSKESTQCTQPKRYQPGMETWADQWCLWSIDYSQLYQMNDLQPYPYEVLKVSNWYCFFLYMLSLTIQSNLWHWNRQSRRTWVLVWTQGDIGWPGSSTAKIYIHIMILVLFSSIYKVSIIFWVLLFHSNLCD